MHIVKGTNRVVFIGKKYTIKVPRIAPRQVVREASLVTRSFFRCIKDLSVKESINVSFGIWKTTSQTTAGIRANFREWKYSKKLGISVVPTRFSFLGLFNVMDTAWPWHMTQRYLRAHYPFEHISGHTTDNPHNFGWHDGRVKLLDYGDIKIIRYLLENKAIFRRQLDAFVRENR
jgi:hypothetical protein